MRTLPRAAAEKINWSCYSNVPWEGLSCLGGLEGPLPDFLIVLSPDCPRVADGLLFLRPARRNSSSCRRYRVVALHFLSELAPKDEATLFSPVKW